QSRHWRGARGWGQVRRWPERGRFGRAAHDRVRRFVGFPFGDAPDPALLLSMSPVVAEGRRIPVPGKSGLSIWLPSDWELVEGQIFELLALGPVEETYRANLSIIHLNVDAALTLDQIADAAARIQARTLETFVEYDRRPVDVADLFGLQREYGWVQS